MTRQAVAIGPPLQPQFLSRLTGLHGLTLSSHVLKGRTKTPQQTQLGRTPPSEATAMTAPHLLMLRAALPMTQERQISPDVFTTTVGRPRPIHVLQNEHPPPRPLPKGRAIRRRQAGQAGRTLTSRIPV